ncbi:metallophosphoesterase [Candidatus Woesearchaeota archaeon]|nr:metallophosphoesterase [Candidatus Woesearchaeota archaeon]
MKIGPNLEVLGLSLWLKREKVLILSDLHLGYEEYLHQKGVLLPKAQAQLIRKELQKIFQIIKPTIIIINGDLKHEFGRVLRQEWKEVLQLIDFLQQHCKKLILIRGNHDLILGPIAEKKALKIISEHRVGDTLITHGDKLIKTTAKTIIIGHEHPAITLREKSKVEKFKCFLKGRWNGKTLIVMPSFNPLLEGTDIIKEKLLSPFLKDVSDFEVFVVHAGEMFRLGRVKELKS